MAAGTSLSPLVGIWGENELKSWNESSAAASTSRGYSKQQAPTLSLSLIRKKALLSEAVLNLVFSSSEGLEVVPTPKAGGHVAK